MSFVVDKWYLDLVTADGVVVVGYRLAVRWLAFDLQMASRLRAAPGEATDERSTPHETSIPHLAVTPSLGAMVAGRLGSMQEHKQCARSWLVDARGLPLDDGWTFHEAVTW